MQRDFSTLLDMTRSLLERRTTLWIVSALIVLLFVATNLPWQLDDYDQAKQAYTSFEIVNAGHWFYQHTPHERIATKPPLVGWISAALFAITRSWELAWRLPSLLAAVALLILLFRAASASDGSATGLIASSAFGLNLLTPRLATLVRTDMPLALVIFLIGLFIWKKIRAQTAWTMRDRVSIFLLLTAGMLIKGPIVYAFLLPGIATAVVYDRRKILNAWCGWWPWLASLVIFLVWAIGGVIFQPGFFDQVVLHEFLGRFSETVHRPQPVYFYLPHLLHKFAPWSVLILALALFGVEKPDRLNRSSLEARNARRFPPGMVWLIGWALGGLIVMSLVPSKRVDRIFPVIPPLCLLLAAQLGAAPKDETRRQRIWWWSAVALVLSIVFATIYTGLKVMAAYREHRDALVQFGRDVRAETERHQWRYAVISTGDEGLLLYLRQLHFVTPATAVAQWNGGQIDALVTTENSAPGLMRQLHDASFSGLRSHPSGRDNIVYVLITH
jgi:4-amino-4-deoxy-L-arabinose transferase-like glycosyltransferase